MDKKYMDKEYIWVMKKKKKRLEYMVVPDKPRPTPRSPMSNVVLILQKYLRFRELLR